MRSAKITVSAVWAFGVAVTAVCSCSAGYRNAAVEDGGSATDSPPDVASEWASGISADGDRDAEGGADVVLSSGDSAVDADSGTETCAVTCVDSAPSGWLGPFASWSGSPTPSLPCVGSWNGLPVNAFDGLNAPPAACACVCDPPTGQTCAPLTASFFFMACADACESVTLTPGCQAAGGSCGSSYTTYYETSAPTPPTGGVCSSSHASTTTPQPSWSTEIQLCAYSGTSSGAGCGAAQSCVDAPAAPYGPLCIYAQGSNPCPAGPYSVRTGYYQGTSDSRGCTTCGCDGPTGGSCTGGGGVAFYEPSCSNNGQTSIGAGAGCSATNFAGVGSVQGSLPSLAEGACTASGGQPTGSVSPSSPITVCCMP